MCVYLSLSLYIYIYIYIHTYTHIYISLSLSLSLSLCIYIYIYIEREREREKRPCGPQGTHTLSDGFLTLPESPNKYKHKTTTTIFSLTVSFPRVGLPRNLFLIGSLTAGLRFSKGWVRKDLNLVMRIGCTQDGKVRKGDD